MSVKEEVGSSITIMRALVESALAISTSTLLLRNREKSAERGPRRKIQTNFCQVAARLFGYFLSIHEAEEPAGKRFASQEDVPADVEIIEIV